MMSVSDTSQADSVPSSDPVASSPTSQADVSTSTTATPTADTSPTAGGTVEQGGQTAAPAEATNPRAEIDELATSLGFQPGDLANFTDVESARAAVTSHINNIAKQGLQGPARQQAPAPGVQPSVPAVATQAPVPQQQSAPTGIDLASLGLDENDPAAKAIRALEAQVATGTEQVSAVQQAVQAIERQAAEAQHQRLVSEADNIIAGFESPVYGVPGRRTAAQEWATSRLFDLADAIAVGAHNQGRAIPPLQARLAQARLIDAANNPGQPAASTPAPATQVLPEQSHGGAPAIEPMTLTDSWSSNPELMALVQGRRG